MHIHVYTSMYNWTEKIGKSYLAILFHSFRNFIKGKGFMKKICSCTLKKYQQENDVIRLYLNLTKFENIQENFQRYRRKNKS